ncbi:MAG: hypothetical protein H6747_11165 [Deltaproteobacteria bacterium]|nr:hypothetical protein [Deltaproteobacteria bacterium]
MRRWLLAPLLALLVAGAGCASDDGGGGETGPALRMNQIQVVGTHNSYHKRPKTGGPKDWQYDHAPLDVQAGDLGVRQFELDVHWNAEAGKFEVHHVTLLDAETTCATLQACLSALRSFSDANPSHVPLWVWIESKDANDTIIDGNLLDKLEAEIAAIWPAERRVDPDDVRGDAPDLMTAVQNEGWPLLSEVRGRAMFSLLDGDKVRDAYVAAHPKLEGRILFAEGKPTDPWAAASKIDDPFAAQAIADALAAGQLIRTRADSTDEPWAGDTKRREQALASGAQACSTDFPQEVAEPAGYSVTLPGGVAARCNPVTAPAGCRDADIEK